MERIVYRKGTPHTVTYDDADHDFVVFGGITKDQFIKACEMYMGKG